MHEYNLEGANGGTQFEVNYWQFFLFINFG